jgi:hypothetical protein
MTERKLPLGAAPPPNTEEVRLRITRTLGGSIDGIHLDRFRRGRVYEVSTLFACYLLAEGAAEPVSDDTPAEILPPEQQLFAPLGDPPARNLGLPKAPTHETTSAPAEAADRVPPRRRRLIVKRR